MIIGGIETVLVNTVEALKQYPDIRVQIITHTRIREPLHAKWLESNPQLDVFVYYPLQNWFESLKTYCRVFPLKQLRKILFSIYKKYRRICAKLSGRLSHTDVFIDYANCNFFKELAYFKQPKIAWIHGSLSFYHSHKAFTHIGRYQKIVAITDEFVAAFRDLYPEYANKIMRIYNPIDVQKIRCLAAHGSHPTGQYFCHVSRLDRDKDIPTLLSAFNQFAARHKNVRLYIIGDGAMAARYRDAAASLPAAPRIIFTGALNNPYAYMRGAVANILSSQSEGLPTVVLESVVLGRPTISSNCKSGPKEILLNGRGGLLFDVGNAAQLAEQMAYVMDNDAEIKKMTNQAMRELCRFVPEKITPEIVALIQSTCQDAAIKKH